MLMRYRTEVEKEKEDPLLLTYTETILEWWGEEQGENFWNVKKKVDEDLPRTNNAVEGFHSALHSSIICKHPNIWKLIAALKKEKRITTNQNNPCEQRWCSSKKEDLQKYRSSTKYSIVNTYDNSNKISFLDNIAEILTS